MWNRYGNPMESHNQEINKCKDRNLKKNREHKKRINIENAWYLNSKSPSKGRAKIRDEKMVGNAIKKFVAKRKNKFTNYQ